MADNLFYSFDLRQAEWIVCAFFGQDGNMMRVYEEGKDPHVWTGYLISGVPEDLIRNEAKIVGHETNSLLIEEKRRKEMPELFQEGNWFLPRTMSIRQMGKKANHGLNLDESAEGFALVYEIEYSESRRIYAGYHNGYPGIQKGMHSYVQDCLRKDRILKNCFGEKRHFRDAWGRDLFREAYAFVPQSTVVHITDNAMILAYEDASSHMRDVELMQEVHDSLTCQYPVGDWKSTAKMIDTMRRLMSPTCAYWGRDFTIGVDLKVGTDAGGSMVEMHIPNTLGGIESELKKAYKQLTTQSKKK
jgi:DNA polymerase I-like protein with 3'-5' exonuclease and polymerase domains